LPPNPNMSRPFVLFVTGPSGTFPLRILVVAPLYLILRDAEEDL
jgi:hypothetical protein